jgi:hypothetical protein
VTHLDAPLAVFGPPASDAVSDLLDSRGINATLSHRGDVAEPGIVEIQPGHWRLQVDRVISPPRLSAGQHLRWLYTDQFSLSGSGVGACLGRRDRTEFPIKHGGIASHQADTAAERIAAPAGVPVELKPICAVIQAVLLGGDKPLFVSARLGLSGYYDSSSAASEKPTRSSPAKVGAKYLAPYLESRCLATADELDG